MNLFKNNFLNLTLIILAALCIYTGAIIAQVSVTSVKEGTDLSGKKGVLYALPQVFIGIDITVDKTEYFAGPYAEYASKYLDLDEVSTSNFNEFRITDMELYAVSEPDPNHFYFVEFDEKTAKENKAMILSLSEQGLITGMHGPFSTEAIQKEAKSKINVTNEGDFFQYYAETNLYEHTDTIIKKVVVDTVSVETFYFDKKWVEKSSETKALEAANKISKIRENRFNLLTGYHEIPYPAGTMQYMDEQLEKMLQEYLSLFTGIKVKKTLHYKFLVLPQAGEKSNMLPVFVFSERGGLKEVSSAGGEKIYVQIEHIDTESIQTVLNSQTQSDGSNGLFYRIPIPAKVSLEINNDLRTEGFFNIPQYGVVTSLPSTITNVQFHPESGGLKSIIVE